MKKLIIPVLFLLIASAGCGPKETKEETATADFLAMNIDSTFDPAEDFFMYANNGWFKNNPIPESEQSNGLWQLIRDTINAQVKEICESSAANATAEKGSNKQKIGDFFFSGMDSVSINQSGLSAIKQEMDMIDAVADPENFTKVVAMIHALEGSPLFGMMVGQDDRISNKNAIFVYQGGLSMPDRSFYFDTDERAAANRAKFVEHLERMFILIGQDEATAKKSASGVMKLETAIAKSSRKREDTRDPEKNYNKMPVTALKKSYPNFNWDLFFSQKGLVNPDTVIVGQPEFLAGVNGYLKTIPLNDWKNYLKYHLVRNVASYLDDQTYAEFFNFYYTTLRGIPQPKPRWKRVTETTNGQLGELIGQVYVKEYLPQGTKEKLLEIGTTIREVFAVRIKKLDWMSDSTKVRALNKLSGIRMKVGYPDKWKDMSALDVDRSSYVRNVMRAKNWHMNDNTAKYGKPVDRDEWTMYPQTYNAYYNPSNNEIVVPGCNIIVPGYERKMADDAILYSIIGGSTFGHEITHGFDDQGSKYDEFGNLNNWWMPEDSARFFSKTKLVVDQFSEYVAVDSLRINGEMTQGENIADIGGIMMGYEAFQQTKQYMEKQEIGGLSADERFFLGYALAWMINDRPEAIASQVRSDVHSPARFRVIGPLANMPEFYATFGVKEGDFMWRADSLRAKIW